MLKGLSYPMTEQRDPGKNLVFIVEHLQALEAAHPALLGDIRALRQAVLKGSRLSPRDSENLATHLRETHALLTAATHAYEEMILSLTTLTSRLKGAESRGTGGGSGVVERRRAPRRPFGGVAEISTGFSDDHIVGLATELGRFGCFVRTQKSIPAGTKVSLKITHHGDECVTPGEVVHVLAQKGIGIKFEPATPRDEAMLEDWLSRP
jgi:hypothetical protein